MVNNKVRLPLKMLPLGRGDRVDDGVRHLRSSSNTLNAANMIQLTTKRNLIQLLAIKYAAYIKLLPY